MHRRFALAVLTPIVCAALAACQPTAKSVASNPPAPAPAAPPTASPAKMATMVCRNSQTGAKVDCGTPNAVPVAVKTD